MIGCCSGSKYGGVVIDGDISGWKYGVVIDGGISGWTYGVVIDGGINLGVDV